MPVAFKREQAARPAHSTGPDRQPSAMQQHRSRLVAGRSGPLRRGAPGRCALPRCCAKVSNYPV